MVFGGQGGGLFRNRGSFSLICQFSVYVLMIGFLLSKADISVLGGELTVELPPGF